MAGFTDPRPRPRAQQVLLPGAPPPQESPAAPPFVPLHPDEGGIQPARIAAPTPAAASPIAHATQLPLFPLETEQPYTVPPPAPRHRRKEPAVV